MPAPISVLAPAQEWGVENAKRNNASVHVGTSDNCAGTEEVQDDIVGAKVEGFPDFGHNMKKYWPVTNYLNLNHASLGSTPTCVIEAKMNMLWQMNTRLDPWDRRHVEPRQTAVHEQVAPLLGTVREHVVIMMNTRHAINTIVYNIKFEPGDIIVMYTTTFTPIQETIKCVCDRDEGVRIEVIDVTFPCAHSELVEATDAVLHKYNKPTGATRGGDRPPVPQGVGVGTERVRLVLMDGISCVPGVISPWEDITRLRHKYGALSLVDGAHLIGQQIVDVKKADPDFLVSNMHKWLYTHLSNAVAYVAPRNHSLIHTSFPTGFTYESDKYPRPVQLLPTVDVSSYLTIPVALKFRRDIGGEERIIAGGKRLVKRWSTSILENEHGELTACMINAELPIAVPTDAGEQRQMELFMEDMLMEADIFTPMSVHNRKWYTRVSGQVWVELSDFDVLGDAYDEVAEAVRRGEHLHERPPLSIIND
ncbi:hypothetical protein CspeluHIS016_0302980 [Cutaneotrichosporon spelunceum]|uniref:Aminotransferase class V domain-containing protein n=1 Tax=Cutaneotrichosporon spelunceum TaxID=1672016 RepID=A0AAD3TT83_9TREE|nr:hypothetical protein CspeluHIS016_0302980 [Cutaneotrichosporon spelunceum]